MSQHEDPRVSDFYSTVDAYLRLFGAQHLGQRNVFVRLARYTANAPIDYSETLRILDSIEGLDSWHEAWASVAKRYEELADQALNQGNNTTAADHLVRASSLHHWSQINVPPGDERKTSGRQHSIDAYKRAAPLLDPPAQRFIIPVDGGEVPGYLRIPSGDQAVHLAVLIDGANSVKEEYHLWTESFLERGLATLTFDGPGQGEFSLAMGGAGMLTQGYEDVVTQVIDLGEVRLDDRFAGVGVWGNSFGGYLVARSMAYDERIRAGISLSGFYDFREIRNVSLPVREELRDLMGLDSLDEAIREVEANCNLDDCRGRINVPLLVVHGERDDLVKTPEAREIAALAGEHGQLLLIPDGLHCCYNRYLELRPRLADWLVTRLGPLDTRN